MTTVENRRFHSLTRQALNWSFECNGDFFNSYGFDWDTFAGEMARRLIWVSEKLAALIATAACVFGMRLVS
jgi:hypothetical protein